MLNWDNEQIVLYHGSNMKIDSIGINKTKKESDFGQGFYLTTSKKQAEEWAIRKGKNKLGVVNLYNYSINNDLKIKKFKEADIEWLNFVIYNRNFSSTRKNMYDLIIGPVADDGVREVIEAYLSGLYGNKDYSKAAKEAIRFLEIENLKDQYCFCTDYSLNFLERIDSYAIKNK